MWTLPKPSEWTEAGCFAFMVCFDCCFFFPLAAWYRHRTDKNDDGVIQPEEVPYITRNDTMPVIVERPGMFELSILSFARTVVEAMLHAFCYGCLVVFVMNWTMGDFDKRWAYIITTIMIFMGCCFMCHYATNGIHVVTAHNVHAIYYGFGHLALFFFQDGPDDAYLVPTYAVLRMVIYYLAREYSMPKYPNPGNLMRLYKRDDTTGDWIFGSAPRWSRAEYAGLQQDPEQTETLPNEIPNGKPPYSQMHKWAVTFPTYEIFNTLLSSSFSIGVLAGVLTSKIVGFTGLAPEVSSTSLYLSFLTDAALVTYVQTVGLYGKAENVMYQLVMAKHYPLPSALVLSALGSTCVVFNRGSVDASDAPELVVWGSRVALIITVLLTYVTAVIAFRGHMENRRRDAEMG
jgi:hypothetical protein